LLFRSERIQDCPVDRLRLLKRSHCCAAASAGVQFDSTEFSQARREPSFRVDVIRDGIGAGPLDQLLERAYGDRKLLSFVISSSP